MVDGRITVMGETPDQGGMPLTFGKQSVPFSHRTRSALRITSKIKIMQNIQYQGPIS